MLSRASKKDGKGLELRLPSSLDESPLSTRPDAMGAVPNRGEWHAEHGIPRHHRAWQPEREHALVPEKQPTVREVARVMVAPLQPFEPSVVPTERFHHQRTSERAAALVGLSLTEQVLVERDT